jgi:replicative DNA helicase
MTQKKHPKAGSLPLELPPVPKATEAERGIASIALNHADAFLNQLTEARFDPRDILDPLSKAVVDVIIEQVSRNASTDIRVVFEKVRELYSGIEFHQLSELWTLMPVASALPEFLELVKNAAKRRALLGICHQALVDIGTADKKTPELVSELSMQMDGLSREINPPKAMDTKALIMEAITRYQTGDDQSMRIRTGYEKIDNLTPIRLGDFVVIGGETKSGKTMLALNIIANLLSEHN